MAKKNKKEKKAAASAAASKREHIFGSPVRNLIVTAVVSILLGAAFLLKPYEVSLYCGYGLGGLIGLVGLIYIIIYFARKPVSGEYHSEFAVGLLALLAGAYVALSGLISEGSGVGYVLAIRILGILIIADGLLKLQYSVDIGRMKFRPWWTVLIFSVLGIAIGVLTATDFSPIAIGSRSAPASMLYTVGGNLGLVSNMGQYNTFYSGMTLLGIAFCVNGVLDLAAMTVIAVRNHKARRDEAIAEGSAMVAAAQQEEIDEAMPVVEIPAEPVEQTVFVPSVAEPAEEPVPPAAEPVLAKPADSVE